MSATSSRVYDYHSKAPTPSCPPRTNVVAFGMEEVHEPKQGGKMCYCCCDFRRAVIIVNSIVVILEALVILLVATGTWTYYFDTSTKQLEDHMEPYIIGEVVLSVVSILLSVLAIVGAVRFSIAMVVPNLVWLVLGFFIGIVMVFHSCSEWEDKGSEYYCEINYGSVAFAVAWVIFWCYPHLMYIKEVKAGIMTEETYEREKHSCCCV